MPARKNPRPLRPQASPSGVDVLFSAPVPPAIKRAIEHETLVVAVAREVLPAIIINENDRGAVDFNIKHAFAYADAFVRMKQNRLAVVSALPPKKKAKK